MGGFNKDSVGATIIGSDSNGFIQEPVKVFDANSFVVAASGNMNIDIQNGANGLKEAFECAAVVNDEKTAETNF
jgi:hypothetical protein